MGETADDMFDRFICSWRGICFHEAHGYPVVCLNCYRNWIEDQKRNGKKYNRRLDDLLKPETEGDDRESDD